MNVQNITKNHFISLPIILQNLIYEYSENYRTEMNNTLKELIKNKKIEEETKNNKKKLCNIISSNKIEFLTCKYCLIKKAVSVYLYSEDSFYKKYRFKNYYCSSYCFEYCQLSNGIKNINHKMSKKKLQSILHFTN